MLQIHLICSESMSITIQCSKKMKSKINLLVLAISDIFLGHSSETGAVTILICTK